jgi:hypothetical protein
MVDVNHAELGTDVEVINKTGLVNEAGTERAVIVERPFYDPRKSLAAA